MAKKKRGDIEAIPKSHRPYIIFCLALFFILIFGGAMKAFGATYYIQDSTVNDNASDANNGESWALSFASLDRVNNAMTGGDTVFFGAGTYRGRLDPPTGATVNDRTCYADSGLSLDPVEYTGLSHITGAEVVTDWTVYSGNTYKSYLAYTPITDYPAMYTASDNDSLLAWAGSIAAVDAPGEYFHDATTDSVYIYCYDGGNPNTHTILIANHYSVVSLGNNHDYITFIGLEISYGNSGVMLISNQNATNKPDYVTVSHCVVHHANNDGGAQNPCCIGTRSGITDSAMNAHGDTIRACTLYANRNGSNWFGHNKCIVLYAVSSCVVESCYTTGGGIGINVKEGDGTLSRWNVIRYNTITNASCGINFTAYHFFDSTYGNIVRQDVNNNNWGITYEGVHTDSACMTYNNTIINYGLPFVVGPYSDDGIDGSGDNRYFFKYNIVDFGGTRAFLTFNDDPTDYENMFWDSNYYYQNGSTVYYSINDVGHSWAEWQALGQDIHSSTVTDPGLNENYEPTNISAWSSSITYGGRTWYGPGAVQSLWEGEPPPEPGTRYKMRMKK